MPQAAALITIAGIVALLLADRDRVRLSTALWIPLIWLLIGASRPVSNWLTLSAPVSAGEQYLEGSPFDRNILSVLVAATAVVLLQRGARVMAILRGNPALIMFFAFCGASVLWADFPVVLLKRWVRALTDVGVVLIVLTEIHPADAWKRTMMRLTAILVPLSILFIRFFPSLGRSYTAGGAPMWTGVATDKNALGALCMLAGVVLTSRWITLTSNRDAPDRGRKLSVIAVLLGMVLYLLFIIDSKTALACFSMATIVVGLRKFPLLFRSRAVMTVAMAAMIAVAFAVLFMGLGSDALSKMGRDASLTGRTEVWQKVLPMAVNPWIGAGWENFWIGERLNLAAFLVGQGLNQAHNGYIEIYLNIGWVGITLLLALVVVGFRNILREYDVSSELTALKLSLFMICLVYNFTEAAFKFTSPVWIAFLWATMRVPKAKVAAVSNRLDSLHNRRPVHAGTESRINLSGGAQSLRHPTFTVR